ncbi:MAG: hypothetical protein AAFR74_08685 [Pseudomonadota bacterium]
MTRQDQILIAIVIVAAAALYLWQGRPGLSEQPFADRAAEIAAADPSTLSTDELLTRLQSLAAAQPEDAEPHFFIGNLLRSNGRAEDAVRAYQSALRRDDRHVPSLVALADVLTNDNGGEIGDVSAQLYERAWRLDTSQVRAGFLAGLSAYRDGRDEEAFARWNAIEEALESDDSARGMLSAMIETAKAERTGPLESP